MTESPQELNRYFAGRHSIVAAAEVRSSRSHSLTAASKCLAIVLLGGVLLGCAEERPSLKDPYRERYGRPLVSSGTLFAALPPAVQNTVRAETGSAAIADVVKYTSSGRIVYQIFFQNRDLFPPLYVASDGTPLDPNLTVAIGAPQDISNVVTGGPVAGVTLNDLPPMVVKSLQRTVPDAVVDSIVKQVNGDKTTYLITFKDRMHPTLQLASDGTVVAEPAR
jgi:hypothetical protein